MKIKTHLLFVLAILVLQAAPQTPRRFIIDAHSSPDAVYAFEKLFFGTDEEPENLEACLGRYEAMLDACGVPEASRRKIYGETMARLLGITVR